MSKNDALSAKVSSLRGVVAGRIVACALGLCGALGVIGLEPASAGAFAQQPQWAVTAVSKPTNFAPEDLSGQAVYRIQITNTGGAASDESMPITITDELPAGLMLAPQGMSGIDELARYRQEQLGAKFKCVLSTCIFTGSVVPEDSLIVTVPVDVMLAEGNTVTNVVRIGGGGATDAVMRTPTTISSAPAGFGISPGGATTALSTTQAGAHPDITTSIAFNTVNHKGSLAANPKDLVTEEPPGFAGDLVDTPTCAPAQFSLVKCPVASQIGVVTLTILETTDTEPHLETVPVYNLAPNPGEAAKFGFGVAGNNFNVQGNVSVRPGDYGLKVAFHNTNESPAEINAASLTVWGVPTAAIHDPWRERPSDKLGEGGGFGIASEGVPAPFFTNPTACGGTLEATFSANSWEQPGSSVGAQMQFGPIVGCDRLAFPASFTAEPTTDRASAPTGLNVNLAVKQTYENPEGLATATLNKATVTLPEGMTVNPSAGAGLGACSLTQYEEEGFAEEAEKGCPSESKLGTVSIETPSLSEKGEGSVFLAEPAPNGEPNRNPFNSLLAIYVVARFPQRGVLVKVAGRVTPDEHSGRLVTTFERQPALRGVPGLEGLPPVPFSLFTFKFHQGTTSPLVTPPVCGSYSAMAALTPWSRLEDVVIPEARPFTISHGFDGGSCPTGVPPFAPQVLAGTENNRGGSYSPMYIRLIRGDGEQEVTRFSSVLPAGLTANLSGVPFCPDQDIDLARRKTGGEEQAVPSCPAASEIGHTLVGAGVGSVLAWASGKVYMAGPYNGAPFSIVAISAAKVGPFDLGTVVVREALRIDPNTAVVTVDASASDPIPHIIKGIVVHVRDIRVYINRPHFTVNPTSCARMTFSATVEGAGADPTSAVGGTTSMTSDPFQAADCQALKFKPAFRVSTSGKTSRASGASLTVRLTYPKLPEGTQANIRSVKVSLPKQLPSRLTTLQHACPDGVFRVNPASCPAASRVGAAVAITPILPVSLSGPAYFVSHGGAKFPELIIVLQGYGITVELHGETFINKKGITSSTFRTVPDQPVSRFELKLPQGRNSALAANGNLCRTKLKMPTIFKAQNGREIRQSTPISVTGCPKHKVRKARKGL